jgi:hypothetical protein
MKMTTVGERELQVDRTEYPERTIPVEMIENDGQDCAWLKLSGEWSRIASVENLWDIDGQDAGEKASIRMHFRVMISSGRQTLLFQDLIDGCWYREADMSGGKYSEPAPVCRARMVQGKPPVPDNRA